MVENFTDFGHLGYLHDGLLGTNDDLVVPAHRVEHDGHRAPLRADDGGPEHQRPVRR